MVALGVGAAVVYWVLEAVVHSLFFGDDGLVEHLLPTDSHELWMRLCVCALFLGVGFAGQAIVNRLRAAQREQATLAAQLDQALTRVLAGFIPICAACKSVREDDTWTAVDSYITKHTDTQFSHTVCPACAAKLYPDLKRR